MAGEPTLKRGHNNAHDWVVYAQKMLNHALAGGMHLDIPEDGKFTDEMEQEVKAFQSRHGLDDDGTIGPQTWSELHKAAESKHQAAVQASADADAAQEDQSASPAREVHNAPGQKDDNTFHERTDHQGDKVRVYDMDEEVMHGSEWNQAVSLMIDHARINVETQLPYVQSAIMQFEDGTPAKIAQFGQTARQFEQETHIEFPWDLLVDGLDKGLATVFTVEGGVGGWVYEKVKGAFIDQLVSDLTAHASAVPGLEAKLEAGVKALVARVHAETQTAIDGIKAVLREYIEQEMRDTTQVSQDPEWINATVYYLGFPERSMAEVNGPLLSWLNHEFDAMIQAAQEELVNSG